MSSSRKVSYFVSFTFVVLNSGLKSGYGMSEAVSSPHSYVSQLLSLASIPQTVAAITQPQDGYLDGKLNFVPGSTGVLCPGMEARITRADGTDADYNEVGELWLRGENITSGYLKNDKANKETFKDGWLRTGDYFRVDENGYFWYGDRVKVWNSFFAVLIFLTLNM